MKSLVAIVLLVGLKFLATQCSETDEKVVVTNKDEAAKETVKIDMSSMEPVSYTHLTLPTNREV